MVTEEALRMLASGALADVRFAEADDAEATPTPGEYPSGVG